MTTVPETGRPRFPAGPLVAFFLLLAIGLVGWLAFLAFVTDVLAPRQFASYGLIVVSAFAAVASFFSPCSFTVLPGYVAMMPGGGGPRSLQRAAINGGTAALGVLTAIGLLGVAIGLLGTALGPSLSVTSDEPSTVVRGLRIGVGGFLVAMALVHLAGLSHRLPLLGKAATLAIRADPGDRRTLPALYAYGAGYVAIGLG
ncbi:MAG: hypothetical protein HY682_00360 [Chloroflexi bacterium]|nr:hypothetical protein [Chloroflexota bacterium]